MVKLGYPRPNRTNPFLQYLSRAKLCWIARREMQPFGWVLGHRQWARGLPVLFLHRPMKNRMVVQVSLNFQTFPKNGTLRICPSEYGISSELSYILTQ